MVFIHCAYFLTTIFEGNNKSDSAGKTQPSGILRWKAFWKKRRTKINKNDVGNFQQYI